MLWRIYKDSMLLKYFYLDESVRKIDGYWHSVIGGAIVKPESVSEINREISTELTRDVFNGNGNLGLEEFKYTSFYESVDDVTKMQALNKIVNIVKKYEVKFMFSHAYIDHKKIKALNVFRRTEAKFIQNLACINVLHGLIQPLANHNFIQIIVDGGFNEAFKPLHDMYMDIKRGIDNAKVIGFEDKDISIKNYNRILTPVFVDSRDERLIQVSDMMLGEVFCAIENKGGLFKLRVRDALAPLKGDIHLISSEFNKDRQPRH